MGKLSSYAVISGVPASTDLVPITSDNQTKNVPVQNLIRALYITVGPSGSFSDYVCSDYASDDLAIQAAITALQNGQKLFIRNGTYNFLARVNIISKSDIVVEGESKGGVILKAAQSIFVSGNDHHFGLLSIRNHTSTVKNIRIENLTIDANNQLKTQPLTITGGSGEGTAFTKGVRIENVIFKNMGQNSSDTARACVELISNNISLGNFGRIDDIQLINCEFDTSQYFHIYALGNYITNLKILNCYFHDNQNHTITFVQYTASAGGTNRVRSNQNWEIAFCRFQNTKLASSASSIVDIEDDNRTGIKNIKIHDNYFGPQTAFSSEDKISIDLHGCWGIEIKDNFFDQVSEPLSLGHSNAGSYYQIDPDLFTIIQGNIFYKAVKPCIDGDASMFTKWINNQFIYCSDFCIGSYSRHWPSVYDGNTFYNCSVSPIGAEEYHKAAIEIVGDGYIVRGNTFIDDRLLSNPTTAPTLSQTSGGSLSARTYFVKYTWANDTGETLASSESSLAISANNLIKVTVPISNTYPNGATKIKIYISTSTGTETLQDYMDIAYQIETGSLYWPSNAWTEPTTGLVSGTALPSSNTTATKMKYGIYEVGGAGGLKLANDYHDNHFYGIDTPILKSSSYTRITYNNWTNSTISVTGESRLEAQVYDNGNKSGAFTIDIINGEYQKVTLIGNIIPTLSAGQYVGQKLLVDYIQDSTGSRTSTWPSNFKKAGSSLILSIPANSKDRVISEYDGTNWIEERRILAIG